MPEERPRESDERTVSSLDGLKESEFDGIVSNDDGTPRFTVEVVDNTGAGPHEE